MNINDLINIIINKVDRKMPILNQLRFVYLELGKNLQRNTDFFFSVDKKLQDNNLTFKEIEEIYNGEVVLSSKVICRSSCILLKAILDRLGIESKLVKSVNNVIKYEDGENQIDINHWFLAVKDNDGEYIFCTLSSDLPFIQMGMETKHFGGNISYKKELSDGSIIQVYEGEEIKNKVIDKETLRLIDIEIGYIKHEYNYDRQGKQTNEWNAQYDNVSLNMLRDSVRNNKLFMELEIEKSGFIQDVFEFTGSDGRKISFYDDKTDSLTREDWQIWIKKVCGHVLLKIEEIVGYSLNPIPPLESKDWNFESWLFSLSVLIEQDVYDKLEIIDNGEMIDVYIDVTSFDYPKWSKKVKSVFKFDKNYDYENLILLLDKLNALVNYINGRKHNNGLSSLFQSLSSHFVDANDLYINNIDENGKLSNKYIANKFSLMFQRVFGCNQGKTDFNKMGYSEQLIMLKEILGILFPEITVQNSQMVNNYDNRYSPVLNRIQLFPIKNKETGEYAMVFGILGEPGNNEVSGECDFYYFYDLKSNEFKICDILDVYKNYIIISERMKNKFSVEDLENLENKNKSR